MTSPDLRVLRHDDAESLLRCAEPWLLQAEPRTNLVLGLAHSLRAESSANRARPWLLSIHEGNSVIGCALRTPPGDLIITQLERPGVEALIHLLRAELPSLAGVIGPEPSSGEFAAQWSKLHQLPSQLRMRQRFYVLHQLRADLPATPGRLRRATSSDLPLVAEWVAQFTEEVATGDSRDPQEAAERAITRGQLYLWQGSRPGQHGGMDGCDAEREARGLCLHSARRKATRLCRRVRSRAEWCDPLRGRSLLLLVRGSRQSNIECHLCPYRIRAALRCHAVYSRPLAT